MVCLTEILEHICSYFDEATKKSLRLVNNQCEEIVNQSIKGIHNNEFIRERGVDMLPFEQGKALLRLLKKLPSLESVRCRELLVFPRPSRGYYINQFRRELMEAMLTHRKIVHLDVDIAEQVDFECDLLTSQIKTLDISGSYIANDTTNPTQLMRGLFTLPYLEYLDVSGCRFCLQDNPDFPLKFRPQSVEDHFDSLQWPIHPFIHKRQTRLQCWPRLKTLIYDSNLWDCWKTVASLPSLETLIGELDHICIWSSQIDHWPSTLTRLELPRLLPEDRSAPENTLKSMLKITSLQHLHLGSCMLNAKALAQIKLGDWPELKVLHLGMVVGGEDRGNSFSDDIEGAMRGLFNLTCLETLNLYFCHLPQHAFFLIQPHHWPNMKNLDLSCNRYGPDGEEDLRQHFASYSYSVRVEGLWSSDGEEEEEEEEEECL